MTIGEYLSGYKSSDGYTVMVKKHKTATSHGPAPIHIRADLLPCLEEFVHSIRANVVDMPMSAESAVFASWSGKKMSPALVNTQFNSIWKKAGVDLKRRINTTIVRKGRNFSEIIFIYSFITKINMTPIVYVFSSFVVESERFPNS